METGRQGDYHRNWESAKPGELTGMTLKKKMS